MNTTSHSWSYRRSWQIRSIVFSIAVAAATPNDMAGADVLYDTTSMTDKNTYTWGVQNYIGGQPSSQNGSHWDVQAADDFTVPAGSNYKITTVVADFMVLPGDVMPASVLVEFFTDVQGSPEDLSVEATYTQNLSVSLFDDHLFPNLHIGMRLSIDVSADEIILEPGTWWLSVVPVDLKSGERYFWNLQSGQPLIGASVHARNGGVAHGNGLPGAFADFEWHGFGPFPAGDFAMKIEGTPVEPVCPADLADDDGVVNVFDLFVLLSNWNTAGPGAELAEPTNIVNVFDLFVLLSAWGECE